MPYFNEAARLLGLERMVAKLPIRGCYLWSCWPFPTTRTDGYAQFGQGIVPGEKYVHRIVYTLVWGPIPVGHEVDHLCFVRNCINPLHLQAVTLPENRRRRRDAPKMICPRGHARRQLPSGQRYCPTCTAAANRANRARRANLIF